MASTGSPFRMALFPCAKRDFASPLCAIPGGQQRAKASAIVSCREKTPVTPIRIADSENKRTAECASAVRCDRVERKLAGCRIQWPSIGDFQHELHVARPVQCTADLAKVAVEHT